MKEGDMLYKIIGLSGEPLHGGSGRWHLPKRVRPGKWMPELKTVEVCRSGYHLVTAAGVVEWLPRRGAALLCEAEGRGDADNDAEKTAFSQARIVRIVGVLDDVSMRLAAADIAERVLPVFACVMPHDRRPAAAIQAARDYAARAAVGDVVGDAAGDAGDAARDATNAASSAAARAAAGDVVGDAAGDAARASAWDAAWDAAGVAADAAADAARAAAGDVAWASAWDAAWAAHSRIIITRAAWRLRPLAPVPPAGLHGPRGADQ